MLNHSDRPIGLPLRPLQGQSSITAPCAMSAGFGGQRSNAVSGSVAAGEFADSRHPGTRGIRSGAWRR